MKEEVCGCEGGEANNYLLGNVIVNVRKKLQI